MIRATGFFRQKSRSLIGMSTTLVNEHGGTVPASMEALTKLPGVGRKTANVVLGHALGVPGLPVDRHVLRVTNRLGLVRSDDPVKVEAALTEMVPPERWTKTSDSFILARPAHLPSDAAVPALQCAQGLRLRPVGSARPHWQRAVARPPRVPRQRSELAR